MEHLTEDELVLHRYQEAPDAAAAVARHLAACERCRAEYAALDRVLRLLEGDVPEPSPEYERDVWMKIAPRLEGAPGTQDGGLVAWWRALRAWPGEALHSQPPAPSPQPLLWAFAALIALLLAGSFAIGRLVVEPRSGGSRVARGTASTDPAHPAYPGRVARAGDVGADDEASQEALDGVLLVAVGEHLQRSEMMLTEFNNADGRGRGAIDLTAQQALAEDLVSENRLYRQSAAGVGQSQMASLLDDLERVLLEVAHAPSSASAAELDRMRRRLDTRDVLFKVRVAGAGLRAREDGATRVDSSFSETGSGL